MATRELPTRRLRVVARDPAMQDRGRILTDEVDIENEWLGPGPRGRRVYIIDYDSTTQTYYKPIPPNNYGSRLNPKDPFIRASDDVLLQSPGFHAQNVFAIVTRTLSRFENALGRRITWNFGGHQIAAVPHAFADANAFYSDRDRSLMFGYFPARSRKDFVFSCLSHDVIVHETAHALLDSMRPHYSQPGRPDNLAFHEGFADLIALLSVFSFKVVVSAGLDYGSHNLERALVSRKELTLERLRAGVLFGLAEQMGAELTGVLGDALRRSLTLPPSPLYLNRAEFLEPHRRGEILVAAMLNAFVRVWVRRFAALPLVGARNLYRDHVVAMGVEASERLLATAARAIDYAPPLELGFPDFLSALLTADAESSPDDTKDHFRKELMRSFAEYGIRPASPNRDGLWLESPRELVVLATLPEPEDIFRFLYQNWQPLGLADGALTQVQYVRRNQVPAGRDRFNILHEFIAGYLQILRVRARHLHKYGIRRPAALDPETEVSLHGGGTLIFAQNGTLKYHITNRLLSVERQTRTLEFLIQNGSQAGRASSQQYAALHRIRQLDLPYASLDEF